MSRINDPENFAGRVQYAHMVIMAGRETSRAFDNCFENRDGAEVAAVLYNEAEHNPKLRERIGRYLVPTDAIHLRGKSFAEVKAIAAETRRHVMEELSK